ncbi:MAG: type III-B CRISPR module RAMP protein Cmr1 [Armatimonadia bacterium]
MLSVTARIRLLSPLFMNGDKPDSDDRNALPAPSELRPDSLRGVMRYWHRALTASMTDDLGGIRKLETKVFGGAGDSGEVSGVSLRFSQPPPRSDPRKPVKVRPERYEDVGLKYLAYGRMPQGGSEFYPCILPAENDLEIVLSVPGLADAERLLVAADALWLTSVFGGLGGRNRRGFGAFAVTGWECGGPWKLAPALPPTLWDKDRAALAGCIAEGFGKALGREMLEMGSTPKGGSRSISHFRGKGGTFLWGPSASADGDPASASWDAENDGWRGALNAMGGALASWRSGKGKTACLCWETESNCIKDWLKGNRNGVPSADRAGFGLPWAIYSTSVRDHYGRDDPRSNKRATARFSPGGDDKEGRRASPLVMSLIGFDRGTRMVGILTWLSGDFLPMDDRTGQPQAISAKRFIDGKPAQPKVPPDAGKVISPFLGSLQRQSLLEEVPLP